MEKFLLKLICAAVRRYRLRSFQGGPSLSDAEMRELFSAWLEVSQYLRAIDRAPEIDA